MSYQRWPAMQMDVGGRGRRTDSPSELWGECAGHGWVCLRGPQRSVPLPGSLTELEVCPPGHQDGSTTLLCEDGVSAYEEVQSRLTKAPTCPGP